MGSWLRGDGGRAVAWRLVAAAAGGAVVFGLVVLGGEAGAWVALAVAVAGVPVAVAGWLAVAGWRTWRR